MRDVLVAAIAAVIVSTVAAQEYRSSIELVTVPLTVSRRDQSLASTPLTASDFRIFEDGVEQQITLLDLTRRPLSLCIVLDASESMRGMKQRLAAFTVEHVLAGLQREDEVAIVMFSATPQRAMPWTPTPQLPRIDWTKWDVGGSTPLIDALKNGIELIDESRNPRPVVLIVSDGEENASRTLLSQLVRTRRQSETLVYAMRTEQQAVTTPPGIDPTRRDDRAPLRPTEILAPLVGDSGGIVHSVTVRERAAAAARALLEELSSQYTLGYTTKKPPDGKYRRLKVEPTNRQLRVRHRGGYLAQPSSNQSQ